MRNRSWSDLVMAVMIGLCVAVIAEPQGPQPASAATADESTDVAVAARSLAVAVMFEGSRTQASRGDNSGHARTAAAASAADRAVANAANAAGNAARGIEMPFFSFGGDASAE